MSDPSLLHDNILRELIDKSPIAIAVSRGETILYGNQYFLNMIGLARWEDIGDRSLLSFFAPGQRDTIADNIHRRRQGHDVPWQYDSVCQRVDGTQFPVQFFITPINLSDGVAYVSHMIDITQRRNDEAMARDRGEQIRLILDSTAEAIYGVDLQGTCTFCNDACLRMLGYARQEDLLGQNMHEKIHARGKDGPPIPVENCFIHRSIQTGQPAHEDNDMIWRSDGSGIPVETWTHPQYRDGVLVGAVVTCIDISQRKRAQELLQEHERWYKEVYENISDGIFTIGVMPEGKFIVLSFNKAEERLVGLTTADVQGKSPEAFLSPGDAAAVTARFRACVEQKVPIRYEEMLDLPSGRIVSETTLIPIMNEAGAVTRILGVGHDITARMEAEKHMQNSRDFLNSIINAIGDPIFVKDQEHRFVLANAAEAALAGRSPEDMRDKTDYDFFPRGQVDVFWQYDDEVLETGRENVNEEQITDVQGVTRFLSTRKTRHIDAQGNKYVIGIIRDMTRWKTTERLALDARNHLENIINAIGDPIFVKDRHHVWTLVNAAFCAAMGKDRDVLIGKSDYDFFPKEQADVFWEKDEKVFETGEANVNEEFFTPAAGTPIIIVTKKSLYVDASGNKFIVGVIRDITERKKVEESLREALANIKTMKGLIPICASCKRIRTGVGDWQQMEQYIHEHTDADFSHGICDDCLSKLYTHRPEGPGKDDR